MDYIFHFSISKNECLLLRLEKENCMIGTEVVALSLPFLSFTIVAWNCFLDMLGAVMIEFKRTVDDCYHCQMKRPFFLWCNRKRVKKSKILVTCCTVYIGQVTGHFSSWQLRESPHFHCLNGADQHAPSLASPFWFKYMFQNAFAGLWSSRIYGVLVRGVLITV